jgi:hypothetical protein
VSLDHYLLRLPALQQQQQQPESLAKIADEIVIYVGVKPEHGKMKTPVASNMYVAELALQKFCESHLR